MRKIAWPSLLLLLLLIGVSSCTPRGEVEKLRQVEEIIENDPVTAGSLLNYVKVTSLKGEGRARYALLRTQADYKNFVPLTSDSLIRIATRRYGTRRPSADAALAQYYLGCTYKDMGRDLDAIDALLRATNLFPDTTNKYYAYSQLELGKLYLNHWSTNKAQQSLNAYKNYGIVKNDSSIVGCADYFSGRAFLYQGKEKEANDKFHQVVSNVHTAKSFVSESYFQMAKNALYLMNNDTLAYGYLEHFFSLPYSSSSSEGALGVLGDIYLNRCEYDSAYQCFIAILSDSATGISSRCNASKGLSTVALHGSNRDSVEFYVAMYEALLDSTYSLTGQQEINALETNHVIELHDRDLAERHARFLWIAGLALVFLMAGVIISLLMVKKRQQEMELAYQEKLASIRREQIEQNLQPDELNDNDEDLHEEFDTDSVACSLPFSDPRFLFYLKTIEAYRSQFEKSEWAQLLQDKKADILLGKKLNVEKSKTMMDYLTSLCSDLFVYLMDDVSGLSQLDLEYCAMVMLRFKTDQMAYCTQATAHSYYCRRGKMRDKLTDDWYLLIFEKAKRIK